MDDEQNKFQEEDVNNKIKSFQFDQIIKKKPPVNKNSESVQEKINNINLESSQSSKPVNKSIEINNFVKQVSRKKQKIKAFRYGKETFKKLEDLSSFLLLEYQNKEHHANKLLNNKEFINWLKVNVDDKEAFKLWVENVLK